MHPVPQDCQLLQPIRASRMLMAVSTVMTVPIIVAVLHPADVT